MKSIQSLLFVLASVMMFFSANAQKRDIPVLPIGAKAPDFNLKGVDDKYYSLEDFAQFDILMIVFWANHCPTAQAYEDRLIDMVNKYEPKGVGFVAISPNSPLAVNLGELGYSDMGDDFDDMVIRARDKGYNFPYLYDGDDHAGSIPYGPVATPHVFIFDKDRTLQYRGRIDDTENPYVNPNTRDAADAIDALLAGKTPKVQETRSFGCSVKWDWNKEWNETLQERWEAMPVSVELIDVDGIQKIIENETDNVILVNIWATWCGPCVIEFPHLIEIHRMYRGRNFEFISISADNPSLENNVLRFLKNNFASTRNYLYNATDKYALMDAVDDQWQGALPHTLLIAPGGELISRYAGIIDPLTVKRDIVNYLGRYFADDKR